MELVGYRLGPLIDYLKEFCKGVSFVTYYGKFVCSTEFEIFCKEFKSYDHFKIVDKLAELDILKS